MSAEDLEGPPSTDEAAPPRVPIRLEEAISAAAMAVVCLITFVNVVVRYLTDASFAFTEEISIYLMVVIAFVGSAGAFAQRRHIAMEFLVVRQPRRVRIAFEYLALVLGFVLFAMITWYGIDLFLDDWEYGTTSPGIGIPQWIYSVWLPVLSVWILLRIVGRVRRVMRGREA